MVMLEVFQREGQAGSLRNTFREIPVRIAGTIVDALFLGRVVLLLIIVDTNDAVGRRRSCVVDQANRHEREAGGNSAALSDRGTKFSFAFSEASFREMVTTLLLAMAHNLLRES